MCTFAFCFRSSGQGFPWDPDGGGGGVVWMGGEMHGNTPGGLDWISKGQQKHAASSHCVAFAMLARPSMRWMGLVWRAKPGRAFRSPLPSFHAAMAGRVLEDRLGRGKELCSVSFACFFF